MFATVLSVCVCACVCEIVIIAHFAIGANFGLYNSSIVFVVVNEIVIVVVVVSSVSVSVSIVAH